MKHFPPLFRRVALAVVALGALALGTPASAAPARVTVEANVAGESLRLVLQHSKPVVYAIRSSHGRVEVVYAEPVELETEAQRFDDPILDRFQMQGRRTLTFFTGAGFTNYESFELRNPFRVILDLRGSRVVTKPKETRKSEQRRSKKRKTIVVIDPGHGGAELGAVGPTGLREKDVTLDLARRLQKLLRSDRRIDVVLTRDEDRAVGLDERTAIANHNQADLFVSIHLNASRRSDAHGAETYFLSHDATDDEARTVAALENRSYGVQEGSLPNEGEDGLKLVLWDLAQNQYLAESSALAERVQQHMNELAGTRDRGVRQAPFRVLMGATMPAVLVEAGFISNPEEERKFKTLAYRNDLVTAMATAIHEFLQDLKRLEVPENERGRGVRLP